MNHIIPIIIPSLQPDENLVNIVRDLYDNNLGPIVLVDDGSGEEYSDFFERCESNFGCIILRHAVNLGKGRALKDAFNYCLNTWQDMLGCLTADSDGQHSVECIKKCRNALCDNPNNLVLGVRDFGKEDVPQKSRFGNTLTRRVCGALCGVHVTDTQTGLRGIPTGFMKQLLSVAGERFEFETRMLLETKDKWQITEVVIETIYDSKENHATHFDPILDSIRIYKIFVGEFARFIFSSLSSFVIDILLFSLFCGLLDIDNRGKIYLIAATAAARVISSVYNFAINRVFVFHSKSGRTTSAVKYFCLAVVQMLCSAGAVTGIAVLLPNASENLIKIFVDIILFVISFWVQREFVYKK